MIKIKYTYKCNRTGETTERIWNIEQIERGAANDPIWQQCSDKQWIDARLSRREIIEGEDVIKENVDELKETVMTQTYSEGDLVEERKKEIRSS